MPFIALAATGTPALLHAQTAITLRLATIRSFDGVGNMPVPGGTLRTGQPSAVLAIGAGFDRTLSATGWQLDARILHSAKASATSTYICSGDCILLLDARTSSVSSTFLSVGLSSPRLASTPLYVRGGGHIRLRLVDWPDGGQFLAGRYVGLQPGLEVGLGAQWPAAHDVRIELIVGVTKSSPHSAERFDRSLTATIGVAMPT